jgi:pimeloyl-[acyl-carrier protein] methyl ester esterase
MRRNLLLLPGLDGTGLLFARLQHELGSDVHTETISYPNDPIVSLDGLAALVEHRIGDRAATLVAESFSGPIALRIAARRRVQVERLVLVASFAAFGYPMIKFMAHWLPLTTIARVPAPRAAVAAIMLNGGEDAVLVDEVMDVVRAVPSRVAAARIRVLAAVKTADIVCDAPVLAIHALRDRLVGECTRAGLRRACSRIEDRYVDGPHLLNQTHPRRCAELIRAFT